VTRRLVLLIVGAAVVIMVVAGVGLWLLEGQSARNQAIAEVTSAARTFGDTRLANGEEPFTRTEFVRFVEPLLRLTLRLNGAKLLGVSDGHVVSNHTLVPTGTLDAIATSPTIGAASVTSGSTGSQAWATESIEFAITHRTARKGVSSVQHQAVLVLTRQIENTGFPGNFFIVAGAVVAFAAILSFALGRRITRPLRRAVATTQRIAGGDLEARVGTRPGDLPELSALAAAIDSMAEGLGRVRNAERQFLLSVSHELRTPLTSIRGYAEAILDGMAPEPERAAAVIGNEARRLERLVGDLLDLAKLDAHSFSFNFRTTDVAEVVDEVAEELRPLADEAGLALLVFPPAEPAYAQVDPDRLDQVLANLVENAAKYAATTIKLGTFTNGSETRLVVEDDGPGIPASEIGRIFDRHYSADRHARPGRPRGSGLGLAIAAELSAAMGAAVMAESPISATGGTRMLVRLPALPSQLPHISRTPS
jgi:signal transduction histidine kinase